ncbi:MAG TPA: alpha/beta fold hydrolase [Chthoniobacteraceae bacterium]|nr:alpha/beta fold hydrolase [Chthoniobacteraceae bacterium]
MDTAAPTFRTFLLACLLPVLLLSGCATLTPEERALLRPLERAEASLKEARALHRPVAERAGHYLDAAAEAAALFEEIPDHRERIIYNAAAGELTVLLRDHAEQWPAAIRIASPAGRGDYLVTLAPALARAKKPGGPKLWDPAAFSKFKAAGKVSKRGFRKTFEQNGYGGTLVGIRERDDMGKAQQQFSLNAGITAPVTATLEFDPPRHARDTPPGTATPVVVPVTLALHDPAKEDASTLEGEVRPLAVDLTAPLAYYPRRSEFWNGILSMIQIEKYISESGLYLLGPYDPERLPVIFVHGLASTYQMWYNDINEIEADPALRGRCQYWVLSYPSGTPVSYSALRMREDLAAIAALYPPQRGYVVIGHSMGGIIGRMQATTTGLHLWDAYLGPRAPELYAKLPPDNFLKKALIYNANHDVKRLVFICTPHRGSDMAVGSLGRMVARLITLPVTMVNALQTTLGDSLSWLLGSNGGRWPTAIESLSPKNPTLVALSKLPIEARYNSIIGDRGRGGDLSKTSDGIVPYWSSHLEGADSELIVPGSHSSSELPQTVDELKRILTLQLTTPPRQPARTLPKAEAKR